jgi:outer membrane protein OmpA-like peptidoglycan-associated protein
MKLLPAFLLLLSAACAHRTRSVLIDVSRPEVSAKDDALSAENAVRDLQNRIRTGKLPKIHFAKGSTAIASDSDSTLDAIANLMMSDNHLKLVIQAYTDDVGDAAENLDLSERRAREVKAYLARQGVQPPAMRCRGYGAAKPIADNATEEGRAQNRRVEFRFTTREWNAVY